MDCEFIARIFPKWVATREEAASTDAVASFGVCRTDCVIDHRGDGRRIMLFAESALDPLPRSSPHRDSTFRVGGQADDMVREGLRVIWAKEISSFPVSNGLADPGAIAPNAR